ncbi:BLUF domain-containing protein [Fulvimarina sp. 2208YS6-2-32]|uniref:BLUF domain-containing protein n=1 Tax=Fulvimarina uroteuthidis TaxID=3098149 RepID=A0ABU5HWY1_9HYPH|nr:BLUF domain-containing protein [Fulvimarina sp. 2208YS6-2-32]MDY8107639.1 BLUF domain-containing protein [Fulvimarina sp. 2208YS6-2-32]
MRHISYSSIANDLSRDEFHEIVASSAKRNGERGICGVIAYDGRVITQILEGEAETVDALFQKISNDPRHSGVVLMTRVDIAESQFKTFGMARLSPSELFLMSSAIIERFGDGDNCPNALVP